MPTERKAQTIDGLQQILGESALAILTEYRGMRVSELTKLRRELRPKGTEYHVTKNTLLLRAANQLGYTGLDDALAGPTAVAFVKEDISGGAKAILDFAKTNKTIVIKSAILKGKLLSADQIEALTKLPTKEELIAKMLGSLNAPTSNLVNVLAQPPRNLVTALSGVTGNLVNVVAQIQKKLEEGA
jgi:large subunit ribosomal protein L10